MGRIDNMNISEKKLRQLVREVLQEFTTTDTTLGGADLPAGQTSPETQSAYDDWKKSNEDKDDRQKKKDDASSAKADLASKAYQKTVKG